MVMIQGKMRVTHQFRNVMRIFIFSFNTPKVMIHARTHTHTRTYSSDVSIYYTLRSLPLKEVFKLQAFGNNT